MLGCNLNNGLASEAKEKAQLKTEPNKKDLELRMNILFIQFLRVYLFLLGGKCEIDNIVSSFCSFAGKNIYVSFLQDLEWPDNLREGRVYFCLAMENIWKIS